MSRPALHLSLLPTLLVLAIAGQSAQAASLTEAERSAKEARVEALKAELARLESELNDDEAQQETAQALTGTAGEAPDTTGLPASEEIVAQASGKPIEETVEQRRLLERESASNPFAITTHRRNYILPVTYNSSPNEDAFRADDDDPNMDNTELKFQFSAKFNLAEDLVFDNGDLYFAYTQKSWWQAYNGDESSPFRETNYEPEFFLEFQNDYKLWGWTNVSNRISLNHQSNGRSDPLSRSWNRVIGTTAWVNDEWAVAVAPYWRVPEDDNDDDNPDIEDYMGYADITVARQMFGTHEASLMMRGNPDEGNYGSQLDYSWPLFGKVRGHLQYYYGYGESLIDYDERTNRLGIGFSLNPLFSAGSFSP
ncbi:phospholipase A [Halomonas denitrificans]|uniref:phospholipase A n=1 Tax=Halomonas TaxID=2745 RepID=UPI001A902F39|nr:MULTISPECIES: phospholipase A [Halomonas]MED5296681.1 phospholipase A [Pseudomonadota bacterium]MBN8410661.1 phospholipase A [Halomonas litopenaei]MBY5925698.1 phospholipase A [Halomonas sp. DP4Y7-2]MBY5930683.1 phospholipase A [Halomonas sp. DP8Y7-3]MBY5969260.1 phospholipase A [Halomonas denitrificans]